MSSENQDNKWAPWWLYVAVIAGCNLVKSRFVEDLPTALNGLLTLTLAGFLFVAVTVAYRSVKGGSRQRH